METKNIVYLFILFFISLGNFCFGQEKSSLVLGEGFDTRNANPLDWSTASVLSIEQTPIFSEVNFKESSTENNQDSLQFHFIGSVRDYEESILAKATSQKQFSSLNLPTKYQLYQTDFNAITPVYLDAIVAKKTKSLSGGELAPTFKDFVKRLGTDISPAGFIDKFGTHYAASFTYGGRYLVSFSLNKNDLVNSPYDSKKFKNEVQRSIAQLLDSGKYDNPYIHLSQPRILTKGGDENMLNRTNWEKTLTKNPAIISVNAVPIHMLLTSENFPDDPKISSKHDLLKKAIDQCITTAKTYKSPETRTDFYKKFSLVFIQKIVSLEKKSMGKQPAEVPYVGDLFFGAFAKNGAMIKTAPLMLYGDLNTNTLITDETIKVDKSIEFTVSPEDLDAAYVSVWDDTKKLVRGEDRKTLRVSGTKEAQTPVAEALIAPVQKTVTIKTIDNDIFTVTYSLEKKELENFTKLQNHYNTPLESEWISAAVRGDSAKIIALRKQSQTTYINGLIKATIENHQDAKLLNMLFDLGFRPTTEDLDLVFDKEYFTKEKALTLLERGAKPKNNMIYKAVAYKQPAVITALLREGATPVNNDLDFALSIKDYNVLKALTAYEYTDYTFTSSDLFVAAQSADPELLKTFIDKGATGNATVLQAALDTENPEVIQQTIAVTPYSHEIILLALSQKNNDLLTHYLELSNANLPQGLLAQEVQKNALEQLKIILNKRKQENEVLAIAIEKSNPEAAILALEFGAENEKVFELAVTTKNEDLFKYIIANKEYMPTQALELALVMADDSIAQNILKSNNALTITETQLIKAIKNEMQETLNIMVSKADIDLKYSLDYAFKVKNHKAARLIINKLKDFTIDLLLQASQNKYPDLESLIVKIEDSPGNILAAAINAQDLELTKEMISLNAIPNKEDITLAQQYNNEELLLSLITVCNKEDLEEKMLSTAVRAKHDKVVDALIQRGISAEAGLDTALFYKNAKSLELILAAGAAFTNKTILNTVKDNFAEGTLLLLESENDFNTSPEAITALNLICTNYEDIDLIFLNILAKNGLDLDIKNSNGETAMHIAATGPNNKKNLIAKLLDLGANPTLKNNAGSTPLDYATDEDIIKLLAAATR